MRSSTEKAFAKLYRLLLVLIVPLVLIVSLFYFSPFLLVGRRAEQWSEDVRFQLRAHRVTMAPIVLVTIDDATLAAWPEPSVAFGAHLASVMENAFSAGARVVGMDMILSMDSDAYIWTVAQETMRLEGRSEDQIAQMEPRTYGVPSLTPTATLASFIESKSDHIVLSNDASDRLNRTLANSGARIGDVTLQAILRQQDGTAVRRLTFGTPNYPSFAAELARAYGKTVPQSGNFLINYASVQPGKSFPLFSAKEVADPHPRQELVRAFKGAVVLICSNSNIGANDMQTVPGGKLFPGTEILAHGLSSLLDGCALVRLPKATEVMIVFAVTTFSGLVLTRLRFSIGLLLVITIVVSWGMIVYQYFAQANLLLPFVAPSLALALPFAVQHLLTALDERRLRHAIEQTFGRFAGPEVRDYLLESARNRDLGGQKAEATMLFFDLRGSTPFAEGRSPDAVMKELNTVFSRIVPMILKEEGLVLRYTGDGLLALFGAPRPQADHARAAVEAARAVSRSLGGINWGFGIGIHSGPIVFGNLGSVDRPDFTVIGDAVNVAARLQEMTKAQGVSIVMSEATYQMAGCPSDATGPIPQEIRGRKEPLSIYCMTIEEEMP